MASLPESRDERIRELWRIWRQLEEENAPEDWTPKDIKDAKAALLTRLLNECEPEILEALPGRIFSAVFSVALGSPWRTARRS
jgi:hypothetical protein